ncbi:hypothetical protein J8804_08755, partial [Klebsiella pneumoniae]
YTLLVGLSYYFHVFYSSERSPSNSSKKPSDNSLTSISGITKDKSPKINKASFKSIPLKHTAPPTKLERSFKFC